MTADTTVVIVEDEWLQALGLLHLCEDMGVRVLGLARSASEAEAELASLEADALLTDMDLDHEDAGSGDGVDVVHKLRKRRPGLRVVFVTGTSDPEKMARISSAKPHRVLTKPVSERDLQQALA